MFFHTTIFLIYFHDYPEKQNTEIKLHNFPDFIPVLYFDLLAIECKKREANLNLPTCTVRAVAKTVKNKVGCELKVQLTPKSTFFLADKLCK